MDNKESADKNRYKRTGVKRRGQLIKRAIWNEDNPGKVAAKEDIETRPSRVNPGQMIEYVKVFRDRDEDKLDFSEEEGESVNHRHEIDNGSFIISSEQVRNAVDAVARKSLKLGTTSTFTAETSSGYSGLGMGGRGPVAKAYPRLSPA